MPSHAPLQARPRLSQHDKTVRSKEYGKGFNQQRKVRLPLTAWRQLDDLAARCGTSVPGLVLALAHSDEATRQQLKRWAINAAREHGHFLEYEREDGTRTRVRAGYYRRGGVR